MTNTCVVCGLPLKRGNSEAHSGACWAKWNRTKNERVDPEFHADQVQGGFSYDEVSVLL